MKYITIHVLEYRTNITSAASNRPYWDRSRNKWAWVNFEKKNMAAMMSDGPSPHFPSLSLGLTIRQPSRCHRAQSLLGPWFHDPKTPHVLESHPEHAAPLSRCDDKRRHAVGSHPALALCLYLIACNPSSRCRFWVFNHLCSNLFQSFYSRWIMETRSLNCDPCMCSYFSIICLCFSDKNELQL